MVMDTAKIAEILCKARKAVCTTCSDCASHVWYTIVDDFAKQLGIESNVFRVACGGSEEDSDADFE